MHSLLYRIPERKMTSQWTNATSSRDPEAQCTSETDLETELASEAVLIKQSEFDCVTKEGDSRFLVEIQWWQKWQKFVGYEHKHRMGEENPGPVTNSSLFEDADTDTLRANLGQSEYHAVDESSWNMLTRKYGLSKGSRQIERKVLQALSTSIDVTLELYPLELQVCIGSDPLTRSRKRVSRMDSLSKFEMSLKNDYDIKEEVECELSIVGKENSILSNREQSLEDAGIGNEHVIMLKIIKEPSDKVSYLRNAYNTLRQGLYDRLAHGQSPHMKRLQDSCRGETHRANPFKSEAMPISVSLTTPKMVQPGNCGLTNLGNTCFMNSALQCICHTEPLREYMLQIPDAKYNQCINRCSHHGTKGEIAISFRRLLKILWSGKKKVVAPIDIKEKLSKFAPRFSGYQQQDSQEFMAFLLDGLHEDLNQVLIKPRVRRAMLTNGRTDDDIADESWFRYLKRNQSVIVKLFKGQLKRKITCPECKNEFRTFDPFLFLEVPLPIEKTNSIVITVIRNDTISNIRKYKLKVSKSPSVLEVKQELEKMTKIPLLKLAIVRLSPYSITVGNDEDKVCCYECKEQETFGVELLDAKHQGYRVFACHWEKKHTDLSYYGGDPECQLFGYPVVVNVQACTQSHIYRAIAEKCVLNFSSQTDQEHEEFGLNYFVVYFTFPDSTLANAQQHNGAAEWSGHIQNNPDDYCSEVFDVKFVDEYSSEQENVPNLICVACEWESSARKTFYSQSVQKSCKEAKDDYNGLCEKTEDDSSGVKKTELMDCFLLMSGESTLSRTCGEGCGKIVQATTTLSLWKLPLILIIHLQRFYDNEFKHKEKLDTYIKFPLRDFKLGSFVSNPLERDPVYDLFAVCNHTGTMSEGHYTTYAKIKDHEKETWLYFNDTVVEEVSEDKIVTSAAYVLFYHRQNPIAAMEYDVTHLMQSIASEVEKLAKRYDSCQ